jgi:cytidylate kinase
VKAPIIAIDGPAGTGKSSTAQGVASTLQWAYVDSGAFYRVAALLTLRHDVDLEDATGRAALRDRLENARIDQRVVGGKLRTWLDDTDVTGAIRSAAVTRIVSRVAEDASVRSIVNQDLRRRVGEKPAVVDGRDIGTVVFPEAFLKIYLVASLEERARRRAREAEPEGRGLDGALLASYGQGLAERDRRDQERAEAPLAAAPDAIRLDTTNLDLETQIARVVRMARDRMNQAS